MVFVIFFIIGHQPAVAFKTEHIMQERNQGSEKVEKMPEMRHFNETHCTIGLHTQTYTVISDQSG